ncbi:MAG: CheR family methyltransferase [Aquabacterium sp.]|uniref:CheR family methyltransferase n=1 Tax=Aquabacterium sp. TaxID=1872578 RepID=UPI003BBE1E9D
MHVVGLGASAGGLDALQAFLRAIPPDSGMAYVVVQHMAAHHATMLGVLLQRVTTMPVQAATQSQPLAPDHVYVIEPGCELTVRQGQLHVDPPSLSEGVHLPIDALFQSMAADLGAFAVGVVLSGMGGDGTEGLRAIKMCGGLTLAQLPESAQFDAMPRRAIESACVDVVDVPAEMPARILQSIRATLHPAKVSVLAQDAALAVILSLVREHCKHDLSLYKASTLIRRIERRLAVHGLASLDAYAAFLRQNAQELDILFAEMLIGVTSFFRDPPLWKSLQDKVLPDLIARRGHDAPLRAWIVGCSTGEEAYSLAMVFQEVKEALPDAAACTLQIFATDLNAEAISVARKGIYPLKAVEQLSASRVARFFTQQDGCVQIDQRIRDMVLFAQHDVSLDPPFTKLDLLSCRNVLIYFNSELQQRLMPLFHYSLRPGGVLVLGNSETVGRSKDLFMPQSPKTGVYLRGDHVLHAGAVDFPVNRHALARRHPQEHIVSNPPKPHLTNLQSLADQLLLQTLSPPAVLVNQSGDILYINGRTGKYLEPAAGKANWNIHVMARPEIRTQLAVAIRQTLHEGLPVEVRGLKLEGDARHTLHITVMAVREPKALEGSVMVVFKEQLAPRRSRLGKAAMTDGEDPAIANELARAREEIQALRQEMQASKEELQAANEALQSINEELQSANEELTTSKEEAQSMNEEMQTINGELQAKLDDLALAQSDMQNLLNSTNIATLFLDSQLNVRRFTEQTTHIFHLREGDIGRPLTDLANTLIYPDLYQDAKDTVRTLIACEKEISTRDGRWFSVRIMPYRTLTNMIQGAVLTFVDITVSKTVESHRRSD